MTLTKEGTERASMVWPKGVKDQIRAVARVQTGEQTMTEYVLDAIRVHLGQSANSATLEKQLRETEFFAQRLADLAVMGGSQNDRLQSLMELEFPSWISTDGWPEAASALVGGHTMMTSEAVPDEVAPSGPTASEPSSAGGQVPGESGSSSSPVGVGSEPEVGAAPPAGPPSDQPWRITESESPRDDLFARLKGKVGDVPGLTTASRIPTPPKPPVEPEVDHDVRAVTVVPAEAFDKIAVEVGLACPTCGDELIEGECWTCS